MNKTGRYIILCFVFLLVIVIAFRLFYGSFRRCYCNTDYGIGLTMKDNYIFFREDHDFFIKKDDYIKIEPNSNFAINFLSDTSIIIWSSCKIDDWEIKLNKLKIENVYIDYPSIDLMFCEYGMGIVYFNYDTDESEYELWQKITDSSYKRQMYYNNKNYNVFYYNKKEMDKMINNCCEKARIVFSPI